MKVVIYITLVVLVATCVAIPSPKWSTISNKVNHLNSFVTDRLIEVLAIARDMENRPLADKISKSVKTAIDEVVEVFDEVQLAIKERTLTQQQAKNYFEQIKSILSNSLNDFRHEIDNDEISSDNIRRLFGEMRGETIEVAGEVNELLKQE